MSDARKLAEFYAGLAAEALPEATVHAVRRHVLDTLGAALAGAGEPVVVAVRNAAALMAGGPGAATVWGRTERLPPVPAALVNGTAAHALELDDASGCDHSGAVVVPAVLAALAVAPAATDADLIAAVAAGYDLGRRVMEASGGYDAHNNAGWHSTGTCGVFAACIAAVRLRRLPAEVGAQALGIALSFASGTWAFLQDGAMTKRLHPGHAAAAGLLASELAVQGMTGPSHAFEASWGGFLSTYAHDTADPAALTVGLGQGWRIHRSSIKPYASCRGTHAAVEAVLALRDGAPAERIEVAVTPTVARMCGGTSAATLLDAQMSLPYAVAVAWLHGAADLPCFAPEVRGSEAARDWMARVDVRRDAAIASNVAARVTLHRADGTRHTRTIDSPLGSWDRPLPDAAVAAKYRSLAAPVLGLAQATALQDAVWALGTGISPHHLAALCGRATETTA